MSWVCKCDRCGNFVEKFPKEGMTIKTIGPDKEERTKHICPICSKSYYNWVHRIDSETHTNDPLDPLYLIRYT